MVLSIAPLPLAGCVIEAGEAAPPTEVAVAGPPPQPVREVRSPPPKNVRAIWVAGYWHWTGMQYTWIPGHWESARAGAEWRAPHYTVREGVYFYEPGGWSTRR
ncbi:MAG: hypothetical protein ACREJ3_15670 [Polyangiaceae bacterium]